MVARPEHLVGRGDELGALDRVLDELDQGRSGSLLLVGEPGIGKTRLLTELAARAEGRGHLVLYGSASELERDDPFALFVDALDEYLEGLDVSRLASLDDQVQIELASVFPSLSSVRRGRQVVLQQERYRTHRAVRALLEHLAKTRPLVLVLDDLHWADSASIELLGALLHRPPSAAALMALAIRHRQIPERLGTALERARRATTLTRLQLGALTLDEARQLLAGMVGDSEVPLFYEESGGNPFYLEQLARSFDRSARADASSGTSPTGIGVPAAVADSLVDELGLLSDRARLLLQGAAVAGDPFELELAAVAAPLPESAAMEAIDELLVLDLARATEVPRRFRFRHPLIRRAVYETSPAGWRLQAHERSADALAGRGATTAARAYHIERSARDGDLDAIAILGEAGEAAARLAPASAARWFTAALRLLGRAASAEARVELLLARAGCLGAAGQLAESRADLLECLEIAPPEPEALRVRVATACASVEHLLGLQKEAHGHLAAALAELGSTESAEAVELMIELTTDALNVGELETMRGWAERAVATATPLGERALLAGTLAVRAWAGAFAGDGERAQRHCDEATELVDELSDQELAGRLGALAHLAAADLYLDRFASCTRHAERGLEIGRATGQGDLFPVVVVMLGRSLWVQGKPFEAGVLFDGAIEAARLAGNVQTLAWDLVNRSLAALAAGDLDLAVTTAEEGFDLTRTRGPGPLSTLAGAALASVMLEAGQADRSVDLLLTRAGGEDLKLIGGGWRARFLELLTRALLATGRRAEAERAAGAAQARADTVSLPSAAAMASLAAAALAIDAGQPTAAAERALAAAAAFEAVAAFWDAARARELAGRAFALAGDADRAALELELAAAAFESFGSLRYRNQAERELRRLGRRIHRRSRPGTPDVLDITALTARELEIAWLVVDRKTNPEIAAELFLSQKTVETHLTNIFNKMGVAGRVALARTVERAGRPPSPT
jgi:DNA-binding CsgD family transcriptional regulator